MVNNHSLHNLRGGRGVHFVSGEVKNPPCNSFGILVYLVIHNNSVTKKKVSGCMIQFDEMILKLSGLESEISALSKTLDIERIRGEAAALEATSQDPEFWTDLANSQKVLAEIKGLQDTIGRFSAMEEKQQELLLLCALANEEEDLSVLPEVEAEYTQLADAIQSCRLTTLLSGTYDSASAIISFHAGAGGTEAQDWAEMLVRMYSRWGEKHGYQVKLLDSLDGDGAGLKSAMLSIEGRNAYGFLRGENGVHRLVRISPFDSSGRRHTSFAAVEVMPQLEEGDTTIQIAPDDLKVDTYRSGGAGGQHVNKTESAIRITHIPSGIVVACQNERSQHQNREVAMRMLKAKLLEIKEREHLEKIEDIKGVQKLIEWGSQIRSYVFMPYTLVKDHRTGFENGNVAAVMDGDLDGFMNAFLSGAASV